MNAPDLDTLRSRWAAEGRRIDEALTLDTDAVRAALSRRAATAFRRHSRWLLFTLLFDVAATVALSAFIAGHWGRWIWSGLGLSLLPLTVAELVVDFRQWLTARHLRMDAPVLQVRATLDALRRRRIRLSKWIFLLSGLLWWPVVLVVLKGLLGVDLLPWIHPSVWWVSAGLGLAFIPVGAWVARWLSRRFSATPGFQRMLEEFGGRSWQVSVERFAAYERFDRAGDADEERGELLDLAVPAELATDVRALRSRLLVGILACASATLLILVFQGSHGGQGVLITSGVLLNLTAVAHMVAQILHRNALGRGPAGARALRDRLMAMIVIRQRVAGLTLVLAPVLVWPLAVVLGLSAFGVNLSAVVPWPAHVLTVAALLGCSVALLRRYRRHPERFARRMVDWLCLGAVSRTRELLARIPE